VDAVQPYPVFSVLPGQDEEATPAEAASAHVPAGAAPVPPHVRAALSRLNRQWQPLGWYICYEDGMYRAHPLITAGDTAYACGEVAASTSAQCLGLNLARLERSR
jgi:hypothetical protein